MGKGRVAPSKGLDYTLATLYGPGLIGKGRVTPSKVSGFLDYTLVTTIWPRFDGGRVGSPLPQSVVSWIIPSLPLDGPGLIGKGRVAPSKGLDYTLATTRRPRLLRELIFYFICLHFSWCCAVWRP